MKIESIIGMKLKDAVSAIPEDTVMHIGAETSYFFVGTKEDYFRDIGQVSKAAHTDARRKVQRTKELVGKSIEKIIKPNAKVKEIRTVLPDLRKAYNDFKEDEEYYLNFIAIPERTVINVYNRIQNDGVIIIIKGTEKGRYWDREEYIAAKNESAGRA